MSKDIENMLPEGIHLNEAMKPDKKFLNFVKDENGESVLNPPNDVYKFHSDSLECDKLDAKECSNALKNMKEYFDKQIEKECRKSIKMLVDTLRDKYSTKWINRDIDALKEKIFIAYLPEDLRKEYLKAKQDS